MEKLKNLKLERKFSANLKQQLSWVASGEKKIKKSKNSQLKIGLIANDRLYYGLQVEGYIYPLLENSWRLSLKHLDLDFILIESCYKTVTGDWFMAQSGYGYNTTELSNLVGFAKEKSIPVIYWFTQDVQYIEMFEHGIALFDHMYCADDRAIGALAEKGIRAEFLPPAVQPALFTRLKKYENNDSLNESRSCFMVFDDLVDMVQRADDRMDFYLSLVSKSSFFFDSINEIWNSKVMALAGLGECVLGTVPYHEKSELFSRSEVLGIFKSNSRTRTENQWSIVEASASHMPVLLEPGVDMGEFQNFCIDCVSYDEFYSEVAALSNDELYKKRISQLNWRRAVQENSFSNRIAEICASLGIEHGWNEYPSATLITPSYRSKFISRAIENYSGQTYLNKEWVFVFNGPIEEYRGIKDQVSYLNEKITFVPSELHAGPCMNSGIAKSDADYVFRMDDDDFYGPNYLLDLMLYTRVMNFDVIGKSFQYFVMDGKPPIYQRTSRNIAFKKPVFATFEEYPKSVNLIAGCSQGGVKDFFKKHPYPVANFAAVDTQWLFSMEGKGEGVVLSSDEFNLLVDRRTGNDHTWVANMDKMQKTSLKYESDLKKVCFV